MRANGQNSIRLVIAAYNEAAVIGVVVADLIACGHSVVVVDDGSIDATASIAGMAGGSCRRHPINLGQGAALGMVIEFALRRGADYIVTFDADGQHRAGDVAALI